MTRAAIACRSTMRWAASTCRGVLDGTCSLPGRPLVLVTDRDPVLPDKMMLVWAHRRTIELPLIELRKQNENAHMESFSGSLKDHCLKEDWFTSLKRKNRLIQAC